MNNLNEVIIEGNLTKDPEIKWLKENEIAVCSFTVAVNKRYKDKEQDKWIEETSYFRVESWSGLASMCFKYLKKGMLIRVVGELKQSLWKEPETEKIRERVYVIAEHVEFKRTKKNDEFEKAKACATDEDYLNSKKARNALDEEVKKQEDI